MLMNGEFVKNPLQGYWHNSGLSSGDVVLIHSSMKRAFRYLTANGYEANPAFIIDSLIDTVGKKGTILFPLFNFDFPDNQQFSMKSTPSQMGTITEYARLNYEGYRTGHPIYSFYALGFCAVEFKNINNKSGYGSDSPFAKLIELNGKIASVDLSDQNSMTMYHFAEEAMRVDYRYFKEFSGTYEDLLGIESQKTYSLFVRDLEKGVITDVNPMGEILWTENLYRGNRPGVNNGMRTILAKKFYQRTVQEIQAGRALGTLYSINKVE
jgi:aminoglycoside N3'-acetyltransferase